MISYWRVASAIFLKDIKLELRTRETIPTLLLFSILVTFMFNFTFDPSPQAMTLVGPGIVWVSYLFTGILGLNRSLALENENGTLEALRLAPTGRDAIFMGKLMGSFVLLMTIEIIMLPLFLVLFDLNLFHLWFLVLAALVTFGLATIGTMFSGMSLNNRVREIVMPLLIIPIALPLTIGAVVATGGIMDGESWSKIDRWIQLIVVFDITFFVLSSFLFEFILEE